MSIGSLGTWELIVILLIVVLVFGSSRIPALAAALGGTIKQFKRGLSGPEPPSADNDVDEQTRRGSEPPKRADT